LLALDEHVARTATYWAAVDKRLAAALDADLAADLVDLTVSAKPLDLPYDPGNLEVLVGRAGPASSSARSMIALPRAASSSARG
jgi:hypothetical protein